MLACELFPGPCWESKRSDFQSGQTREKKKDWAKRRMLYNWHLVNVKPTSGRRETPMPTLKSSVILALSNKAT